MTFLNLNPEEKLANYNKHQQSFYAPLKPIDQVEISTMDLIGADPILSNSVKPMPVGRTITKKVKDLEDDVDNTNISNSFADFKQQTDLIKQAYIPASEKEFGISRTSTTGGPNYQLGTPGETKELLRKRLSLTESGGKYDAHNENTGLNGKKGTGAHGAYQYIWGVHGKEIAKVTGIKTAKEFRESPEAQEKYFDHMYDNWLHPALIKIRNMFPDLELSDTDIMHGVHFRGLSGKDGFINILKRGEMSSKKESNNPTVAAVFEKGRRHEQS